ncbi:amino acid adenylation domain-containing protein [Bacillus thuringiensis]|nr:amino acid adenylation domain-containing protein [Bacillus thuringiensis]
MYSIEQITHENCLHGFFLSSSIKYPDNIALSIEQKVWTYKEIEYTARKWASAILEGLKDPPKRIGIFAYRSEVSYISVLATLFTGAAFVPLNPNHSKDRIQNIVEISELDAIFVDNNSIKKFTDLTNIFSKVPLVLIPESDDLIQLENTLVLNKLDFNRCKPIETFPQVEGESIAYLLFTSGSTGIPKGVPISHNNVSHYITFNKHRYNFSPADRFSQTFDQTFDLSVFDLFMAWASGASVFSMSPMQLLSPATFINENKITVWFSVPSIASLLHKRGLLKPNAFPSLKWSLFCGEALPMKLVKLWEEASPNSIIENLYGPTELTISCMAYRWDPIKSPSECVNGIVPIGKVYQGLEEIVINEESRIVNRNEEGELCICGPQVFPGYWKNRELTRDKFYIATDPESKVEKVYYRTGDLVKYLSNGQLVYINRIDNQVKVMGYRVELSEVEGVLRTDDEVVDAVAMGWPMEEGRVKGLVAFITGSLQDTFNLKKRLSSVLPSYMVPREIYSIQEIPLNVNGKVDRQALKNFLHNEGNKL